MLVFNILLNINSCDFCDYIASITGDFFNLKIFSPAPVNFFKVVKNKHSFLNHAFSTNYLSTKALKFCDKAKNYKGKYNAMLNQ